MMKLIGIRSMLENQSTESVRSLGTREALSETIVFQDAA